MKIRLFFLLILLLCPFHFRAQNASADSLEIMKRSHGFRTTQLILPASLIAVGAVGVSTPWFRSLNREVRDGLAEWRDGRYFHADDYIQYVPVIANFGLSLLGAKAPAQLCGPCSDYRYFLCCYGNYGQRGEVDSG